jgi:hypothetical protein
MQLRLQDLPEECAEALQRLAAVVRVVDVSTLRPNIRRDLASKLARIYVEVRLDEPPQPTAFTALRSRVISPASRSRPERQWRQQIAVGGALALEPGTSVGRDGRRHR